MYDDILGEKEVKETKNNNNKFKDLNERMKKGIIIDKCDCGDECDCPDECDGNCEDCENDECAGC